MDGTIVLPSYEPVIRTLPYITMASGTQTEPVTGQTGQMVFTIVASRTSSTPISGSFLTSNITATAGSDYTRTAATWTIPVGSRTTQVRVPILADTATEVNETFRATIAIDSGNARFRTGQTTLSATGTIRNRQQSSARLSVADVSLADRTTGSVNVPVRRTGDIGSPAYFVAETFTRGSATSGTDYVQLANRRSVIPAGSSSINIPVSIPIPVADQPRETFGLRIRQPSGAVISDGSAVITLPSYRVPALIAFSAPIISVAEYSSALSRGIDFLVSVPVILSRRLTQPVSFNYVLEFSGNDRSGPGRIFRERSGTVTIPAGRLGIAIPLGRGTLSDEPVGAPYIRQRRAIGDSLLLQILGSAIIDFQG